MKYVCVSVCACVCVVQHLEQTDMSSGPVGDVWEMQQQYPAG